MDDKAKQIKENALGSWDKLWNKLEGWGEAIIMNLPNFILATVIFVLALALARFVKKWVLKVLEKPVQQVSIRNLISNVTSIVVVGIGLLLALNIMHLDEMLTSLLAGAGVAGLAIGLALQGTLANTFSGILLAVRKVVSVGDWIETNGYAGTVIDIDLRNTQIREADNNIVVLPNQMILDNPFKNYGLTQRIRCTIQCGVGYESDLDQVIEVCKSAIEDIYPPNPGENIEIHFLEFGGSSINFHVRFWANGQRSLTALEAKSKAIIAIKKAFDAHDINIPFPIRTLQHSTPLQLHTNMEVVSSNDQSVKSEEEEEEEEEPSNR